MQIKELEIEGCYLIELPSFKDNRGEFIKTFNNVSFENIPLKDFSLKEEFYSVSKKNVLRGLHFQNPPKAHNKIIYCISGKVIDFFLDIRKNSYTYGKVIKIELNSEKPELLFLPKGIAHGFLSCSDDSILVYKTDCEYNPECDTGILWSSVELELDDLNYIISERDQNFIAFDKYMSLFE
ncbi:dTDP-4-dehydrorhamnose 3,5-epimerase [Photobacterium phosphoreum]|uniref:dTDP-4-dehydrorhamnose 3,5-epimerase family protein n=1 Tax=Photobacterium phosphoreum TaxID=659 RepID=UPI000D1670A8|nr:dTDP-4-dehydrorhamnose 3,5-epimerase family protein [Photobacterium phosphoreum]PSU63852.1 dTDP-4-dehydrorhamnose 3,5-epimerase [Photobacterium phosphoreum]PSW06418.1 dTDP-4-dehydrorhamnose 3,5-epimerase [Photobacterium phosphoreum]